MKTLTRRKALEITRDMWAWLAKNPTRSKQNWPGFRLKGGNVRLMVYHCACCEFAMVRGVRDCSKCPLLESGVWGPHTTKNGVPCTQYESEYTRWIITPPLMRSKHAIAISHAAKLELAKLKRK